MTGIERLRKLSGDLIHRRLWVVLAVGTEEDWGCCQGDGRTVNDELLSIADQIEREHAEDCFRMGERAAEDAEAAEWVRAHGGLEAVRRMFQDADSRRVELCAALGIDLDKGWSEAMAAMRLRLMPEGMDWLRFKDGEPVPLGGEVTVTVHDEDGDFDRTLAIRSIKYKESGVLLEGTKNEMVILSYGERVRRPAVLASDGEPLEVGQTVWDVDGYGPLVVKALPSKVDQLVVLDNGGTTFYRYPEKLTHKRPDSWERIEEDVTLGVNSYRERYGIKKHDGMTWPQLVREDLVRRCKALAERGK